MEKMDDPPNLRDYPDEIVRLACEKCGRRGQYWKPSLITRFGPDMGLPELCVAIARARLPGSGEASGLRQGQA